MFKAKQVGTTKEYFEMPFLKPHQTETTDDREKDEIKEFNEMRKSSVENCRCTKAKTTTPPPKKTPNFHIIERCMFISKAKSFKYLHRFCFRITQNPLQVPSPVLSFSSSCTMKHAEPAT